MHYNNSSQFCKLLIFIKHTFKEDYKHCELFGTMTTLLIIYVGKSKSIKCQYKLTNICKICKNCHEGHSKYRMLKSYSIFKYSKLYFNL